MGERRGLRSKWRANSHHLRWWTHTFLESLGTGSWSISHCHRRWRNGLLHFLSVWTRFRSRVKTLSSPLSHVVELSYKSFPTGQKSLEFRFTWHRGSSFLWNIWREWPSVVKYWPHQKSTNYFFQLRWKFTWNIRIGFKKILSARCFLVSGLKKGMKTKSKKEKK